jgi:single-strand DNA-binding protein
MSLNRVVLVGRLTRDPELRTSQSGKEIANFSIAVDGFRKDDDSSFFNVVAFGSTASFIGKYLGKGRLIAVDGRLQQRKYTTKDGQARDVVEVLADNVQGLDRAPDSAGGRPAVSKPAVPAKDDFDPFADERGTNDQRKRSDCAGEDMGVLAPRNRP